MKKSISLLAILVFLGCKDEIVKPPNSIVEKSKMEDIIYDLTLLEAIRFQNPAVLDSNQIHPKQFIYKKYKIDSLKLAQNHSYYAADYKNYKILIDSVIKRIENEKKRANKTIKLEEKKEKIRIAQLKKERQRKDSTQAIKLKKGGI